MPPKKKEYMYALYWDESDEWDDSYEKIRRALYGSKEEAINQAMHDILCLRCRVFENGRATLEATGVDPLNPDNPCPDCQGSKFCPSRRILRVEQIEVSELKKFHAESKGVVSPSLNTGKAVWKPEV